MEIPFTSGVSESSLFGCCVLAASPQTKHFGGLGSLCPRRDIPQHSKRDVGTQESSKNPTGRGAFEVSASLLGQLHPNINSGGVSGSPARTHGSPSVLSVEL